MSRRETFAHLCTSFRLLFFRCFVRGAALASILVVVVCLQVSCMVPQTIDAIVESPHPAPHIVLESIQPYLLARVLTLYQQGSTDLAASPQCHCRLEFDSLSVQEQDSTITLEVRWFIDYDTANIPSTRIAFSDQIAPNFDNVTQTIRPLRTFAFDAAAANLSVVQVEVRPPSGSQFALKSLQIDLRHGVLNDFSLAAPLAATGSVTQDGAAVDGGATLTFTDSAPVIPDRVDQVVSVTDKIGRASCRERV